MKSAFRKVSCCAFLALLFSFVLCVLPLVILVDLLLASITALVTWIGRACGANPKAPKDFGEYFTKVIPNCARGIYRDFRNAFKEACQ